MSVYNISHEYCDTDALPAETTNVSSLQPDQFYKICPGQYKDVTLGQPRCGDGSNFSFIVSRPPEDKQGNGREKIVIELSGGGACWDTISCAMQSMFLSFPQEWLGLLVGKSCSSFNDWMGSMLCSKTVGGIDFSEYTFVMIPYCTQDVHLGDEPSTDYGVRHVGGHNLYRTLTWIFDNFPDPSHIFITGCSAGATPLPVVYDLINSHYRENGKQVQINGIADSPVYLTPSYFLENGLQQWNVETILNMIGFDYDTYKSDEDFPSAVLDHTLDDSKPTDKLGFVLHDGDAVSLLYYAFMTGGAEFGSDLFDRNLRRQLNTDIQSEWWAEISDSMSTLTNEHTNFHSFIIEGTDHCTFGLNVPLQFAGFEEWSSMILQETGTSLALNLSTESSLISDLGQLPGNASMAGLGTGNISVSSINSTGESFAGHPKIETNMAGRQLFSPSFSVITILALTWKLLFHNR